MPQLPRQGHLALSSPWAGTHRLPGDPALAHLICLRPVLHPLQPPRVPRGKCPPQLFPESKPEEDSMGQTANEESTHVKDSQVKAPHSSTSSVKSDYFNWDKYLKETGSVSAPSDYFRQAKTPPTNDFKVGMKLEARDPRNIASICVASVIAITGARVHLRLDGSDNKNDFWRLVDSSDIQPVGTCEKEGELLQPPLGYRMNISSWPMFLLRTLTGSELAPAVFFKEDKCIPVVSSTSSASLRSLMRKSSSNKDAALGPSKIVMSTASFDGKAHAVQLPPVNSASFARHFLETFCYNLQCDKLLSSQPFSSSKACLRPVPDKNKPVKEEVKEKKGLKRSLPQYLPFVPVSPKVPKKTACAFKELLPHKGHGKSREKTFFEDSKKSSVGNSLSPMHTSVFKCVSEIASSTSSALIVKKSSTSKIKDTKFHLKKKNEASSSISVPDPSVLKQGFYKDPSTWSVDEVIQFMKHTDPHISGPLADLFRQHEIDGKALLLLKSDLMMKYMGLKLGPGLKLCYYIEKLKEVKYNSKKCMLD